MSVVPLRGGRPEGVNGLSGEMRLPIDALRAGTLRFGGMVALLSKLRIYKAWGRRPCATSRSTGNANSKSDASRNLRNDYISVVWIGCLPVPSSELHVCTGYFLSCRTR